MKRAIEWPAMLVEFKNSAGLRRDIAGVGGGQVESVNDLVNEMGLCKFETSIFVLLDIDSQKISKVTFNGDLKAGTFNILNARVNVALAWAS